MLRGNTHVGRSGRCHHHPFSPMQVEFCKSFGDPAKPRAWSKHTQKPVQANPPLKDKHSVPPEAKKVRRKSLPPISPLSAGCAPWEGGTMGAGMACESSRVVPEGGPPRAMRLSLLLPFTGDLHLCVFHLQDDKKEKVASELEKVSLSC